MRILFLCLSVCASHTLFATNYVFNGNGAYSDPANWAGGLVAPSDLGGGSTITINGIAVTSSSVTVQDMDENGGVVTISIGGSLTLNNGTQFSNAGSIIVNGTLINNTTFQAFPGSSVTVGGTFQNNYWIGNEATITITGGTWNNIGTLDNAFQPTIPGTIIVGCGGSISNSGVFDVGNTTFNTCSAGLSNWGTLAGNATVTGDLANAGILAPGHSPGVYVVTGNYNATATATHNFQVAGITSALYDRLVVNGTASLGGVLNISLISGYTPSGIYDLPIITASTVTGTFSSTSLPSGYTVVYNSDNVTLHFGTPLPVSLTKFSAAVAGNEIQLEWQTSSEENNAGFSVERSANGNDWAPLSFVPGHGNSTVIENYSYTDVAPLQGTNYYRLKQTDLDGNFKYSAVAVASLKTTDRLILYPNPVRGSIYFITPQTGRVQVFNNLGQRVFNTEINDNSSIGLPKLSPGEYIIQLRKPDGNIQSEKFIVATE